MIDFRYHLVSLVSVFLALAVGIVLGAGPLKDTIGATITEDAASLRSQTASLRSQLDTANSGIAHRDDFVTAVTPALVSGQLGGHSVVLVSLPGADTGVVKPLSQALKTAGARVTGQVTIKNDWTDPAKQAFRDQLVTQLQVSPTAGSTTAPAPTATTNEKLSVLLARALVTPEIAQAQRADATAQTLLKGLSGAGLLSVDAEVTSQATEVVMIVPGVDQNDGVKPPTPTAQADTPPTFRELAIMLDGACDGAVVMGPASSAGAGGVIAAVRGDSGSAKVVSTVDTSGSPMGVVATVLALREQLSGGAGNYGFAEGAKSPLPALNGAS
jgi:hypothetical protein